MIFATAVTITLALGALILFVVNWMAATTVALICVVAAGIVAVTSQGSRRRLALTVGCGPAAVLVMWWALALIAPLFD